MKITMITGAANGLGKEFAKLYAADHQNLFLVDLDEEALLYGKKELTDRFPDIEVHTLVADLSQRKELSKVKEHAEKNQWFVNNLVNCAGFGDRTDFKDMDIEKQLKMTEVDCNALLYFTHTFLQDMLRHDEGHIINISSIAGFLPGPFMCTYHACKGFVLLLGESISYELKHTNVHLLTLCPGPFNSKFVSQAHNDFTFSKIKPVSAASVAAFGYKKSGQGKTLAIVGLKNRLTIFITRFFPRKFVTRSSAKTMKKDA